MTAKASRREKEKRARQSGPRDHAGPVPVFYFYAARLWLLLVHTRKVTHQY
jgi:hypothetical protein